MHLEWGLTPRISCLPPEFLPMRHRPLVDDLPSRKMSPVGSSSSHVAHGALEDQCQHALQGLQGKHALLCSCSLHDFQTNRIAMLQA